MRNRLEEVTTVYCCDELFDAGTQDGSRIEGQRVVVEVEAPEGYVAVLKSVHKPAGGANICKACDWRSTCQKADTDFENPNHRCMDFPVISRLTGKTIERADGCNVLFKKRK